VVIILLVLYVAAVVPFTICFVDLGGFETSRSLLHPLRVCDRLSDYFFLMDILINFRTGELSPDGRLIRDPVGTARKYLSGNFWVDFVACLPIFNLRFTIRGTSSQEVSSILKVVRLLRMGRLARSAEQRGGAAAWRIFSKIGGFMLACHWAACIWFLLGYDPRIDEQDVDINFFLDESFVPGSWCDVARQKAALQGGSQISIGDWYVSRSVLPLQSARCLTAPPPFPTSVPLTVGTLLRFTLQ